MRLSLLVLVLANTAFGQTTAPTFITEHDVAVPMRDGTILRAEVWRPQGAGPFAVLVYRTPYGKDAAVKGYSLFRKAVARGYAVVIQDVRGRYASEGEFVAYANERRDGYDTIEWAARQLWSNGRVGTFGLSYPGAVQWLAAVDTPPHLLAMVPAMTYATPQNFFYSGGVFDRSWLGWTWDNIAPDVRRRKNLPGAQTRDAASAAWQREQQRLEGYLPLADLPDLKSIAPWYYEWMEHPPGDPWWQWAELRGKYGRVQAAVLNFSGWHDEAYGPDGATTNFLGLVASRRGKPLRAATVIGPWSHGVPGPETKIGEREMGPGALLAYDEMVLRWMDYHLRDIPNGVDKEKPVRVYLMGENRWLEAATWPLPGTRSVPYYFASARERNKPLALSTERPRRDGSVSFVSDPAHPVVDPHGIYSGPHDYRQMEQRADVVIFETAPLAADVWVVGATVAEVYISVDAPDCDLWVRLLDVAPDGTAMSLHSPGVEVIRASYRNGGPKRELLQPGKVYRLRIPGIRTGNAFKRGHRIRAQVSATWHPHFSRNLQTGELEFHSAAARKAKLTIHYGGAHASRLLLPVVPQAAFPSTGALLK